MKHRFSIKVIHLRNHNQRILPIVTVPGTNQFGVKSSTLLDQSVPCETRSPARLYYLDKNCKRVYLKVISATDLEQPAYDINDSEPEPLTAWYILLPKHWHSYVYYVDDDFEPGGGIRATVFHNGALGRLNELGHLRIAATITSVSGGSITNAVLAGAWEGLKHFRFSSEAFDVLVTKPILKMCQHNFILKSFDLSSSFVCSPNRLAKHLIIAEQRAKQELRQDKSLSKYAKWLEFTIFDKTLNEGLPDPKKNPWFVFLSCNLQTATPWLFTKYEVGNPSWEYRSTPIFTSPGLKVDQQYKKVLAKSITVAEAVAASASYPIVFTPMKKQYKTINGDMSTARLADGGECDNLGVDVVFEDHPYRKNSRGETLPHSIIFCSNAGAPFRDKNKVNRFTHFFRDIFTLYDQNLRVRIHELEIGYSTGQFAGAYWAVDQLQKLLRLLELPQIIDVEQRLLDIIFSLPKGFPNIKKLYNWDGQNPLPRETADFIQLALCKLHNCRTTLDGFEYDEIELIKGIGYLLAAVNCQVYCSNLKYRQDHPEFNREYKHLFDENFFSQVYNLCRKSGFLHGTIRAYKHAYKKFIQKFK